MKTETEMMDAASAGGPQKTDKRDVTVTVYAPKTPDPKQFTWPKNMLVGAAAQEAATAFGYQGGSPGLQKGVDVLDNNKSLVAAGVRDGDTLDLVDKGGGV